MTRFPLFGNTILSRYLRASLLLLAAVTLLGVGSMATLLLGYRTILFENSQKLVNITAVMVEKEIERLKDLTLTIAVNSELQSLLQSSSSEEDPLHMIRVHESITSILYGFDPPDWYVTSIRVYDGVGREIIAGHDPYSLSAAGIAFIMDECRRMGGQVAILTPGSVNEYLVLARQIRSTENLALDEIGFIAVFIDFTELLKRYENMVEDYRMTIHVFDHGKSIGSTDAEILQRLTRSEESGGYWITRIGFRRYFSTLGRGTVTGWSYASMIPLHDLSRRIMALLVIVLLFYSILIPIILRIATRSVNRLTIPIRTLSRMSRELETGNFDISFEDKDLKGSSDEVEHLRKDFGIAINRIRELAREEYEHRLEIQNARFLVLQSQINPHFLYNTLDSVNWMARRDGHKDISTMVKALAKLMRRSLGNTETLISLEDELSSLNEYLSIQSIRFETRLDVRINIEDGLKADLVPPFLFQPLVENAIHYAIEEGEGHGIISLTATQGAGVCRFTVEDSGPGFSEDVISAFTCRTEFTSRGSGIGLGNIRDRLEAIGGDSGMTIGNRPNGGAVVTIWFPTEDKG